MKFAITGGAGFVGSHITRNLVNNGHSVVVIDNLHTGRLQNLSDIKNEYIFHNIEIRHFEKLKKVLKTVDGVFHEAALTIVPESFLKPEEYFDVNVKGTKNVFEISKELSLKVVYASSSSVYGNTTEIPINENFSRVPINPYGKTKLECEFLAEKFAKDGLEVIGLRYFNVYGVGQTGSYAGVITQFLYKLKENNPPIINGDGKQIRDFVYVEDVAKANLIAMESSVKSGFFNIGTGIATSINRLAEIMIKLSNVNVKPVYSRELEGDVKKSQADVALVEKKIGWKYETNLECGLREIF